MAGGLLIGGLVLVTLILIAVIVFTGIATSTGGAPAIIALVLSIIAFLLLIIVTYALVIQLRRLAIVQTILSSPPVAVGATPTIPRAY